MALALSCQRPRRPLTVNRATRVARLRLLGNVFGKIMNPLKNKWSKNFGALRVLQDTITIPLSHFHDLHNPLPQFTLVSSPTRVSFLYYCITNPRLDRGKARRVPFVWTTLDHKEATITRAKWNHGWFGGNENDEEMQRYISPYSHGELRLRLGNRVEETHLGVDNRPRIDNNRRLMSR
ncbi:hypothetical protein APICC_00962 [Apis cerana cerana]|uniref:Uncharacterized protein n=1 Tax=Apis cerana cerana TaxID=94128 RepID=A0A2A3E7T0_APICC|nr:hypothetical protein APICC_00962 [Apis cerana cerana]